MVLDLSVHGQTYVEDCEVCCRPIEFHIEREDGGGVVALQVRRLD